MDRPVLLYGVYVWSTGLGNGVCGMGNGYGVWDMEYEYTMRVWDVTYAVSVYGVWV